MPDGTGGFCLTACSPRANRRTARTAADGPKTDICTRYLGEAAVKITADVNALLHDKEGFGIDLPEGFPQVADFKLIHAYAQNMGGVAGINALALPAGNTPVEIVHNEAVQIRVVALGKNQHLDRHALPVAAVGSHGVEDGVHHRVDQDLHIEHHAAEDKQRHVERSEERRVGKEC